MKKLFIVVFLILQALCGNLILDENVSKEHTITVDGTNLRFYPDSISINEGDTVIIKKANSADNGKIVVALIDDNEATLKRIRRKGNSIALESANEKYETKIFGPNRVKVQGVLVSLYRNF